jgi:glycosyltransferase involved in cell wall biosynthesis
MTLLAYVFVLMPVVLLVYTYAGYPAIMWLLARGKDGDLPTADPEKWPAITVILPVYNEERSIRATLDSILGLDYPPDRRRVLVVSDASTDRTDQIVSEYEGLGVQLVRLPVRAGKTAAENASEPYLQGSILVNTDATIRIMPAALKALIRVFQDPRIGLASGRDVSVSTVAGEANQAESGYVNYEMWVRSLETRTGSIVGASGCFYAIRRELYDTLFPTALSRDFAAALITAENGFRAVSVNEAICLVPRTPSLRSEYRRKVRTMTRGLETLWYKRRLMYSRGLLFGFALASHKLVRWLVFLVAPLVPVGLSLLAAQQVWARWALLAMSIGLLLGVAAFAWPAENRTPRPLAVVGFLLGAQAAGFMAWVKALRGELNPVWEPTRR